MDAFIASHWFPDILILVIILLFALLKGKKGFFKCVIPVVILAAALVGSYFITPYIEPMAQEKLMPFVQEKVIEKIDSSELGNLGNLSELIEKNAAEKEKKTEKEISASDSSLADSIIEKLPESVRELVEKYGVDVGTTVKDKIDDIKIGDGIKEQVSNSVAALVTSAAKKVIHTGCYIVIALALLLVLSIIKAILNPIIEKTPVVGQANKTAGAILGIIEAVLIIYLVVSVMKLFNIGNIVTRAEDTYLLKLFLMIDPKGIVSLVTKK